MDINKICPGCMQEIENRDSVGNCPHCGYNLRQIQSESHQMRPFTILAGKYLVGKVIGEGGFGITYLGFDLNLELVVAIKEFYPNGFVTRESKTTTMVSMYAGKNEADVSKWREGFINEAKNLAKFSNLNGIVEVRDFFNENGTAYIVMEYIDGITLKQYLKQNGGKISADNTFQMMEPVIRSLSKVHDTGMIHRDISPDNIMITKYGGMKLLDFGAAREFVGNAEKSLSIMLKPGYAPEEQYRSRGKQGPWSDVYALTATIYKCITGVTPVESMERMREDTLKSPKELGANISDMQNAAIMQGMAVYAENRLQNMDALHTALYSNGGAMKVVEPPRIQTQSEPSRSDIPNTPNIPEKPEHADTPHSKLPNADGVDKKTILIGAAAVCGILLVFLCIMLVPKKPDNSHRADENAAAAFMEDVPDSMDNPDSTDNSPETDQYVAESMDSVNPETEEGRHEDVEDIVLQIRDKYDKIVDGISSDSYNVITVEEGILAYADQDQIKAVVVKKDYDGSDYNRRFYYDEGRLFFAYYEGIDSSRLYFDGDQLLRWRYCPDAADVSSAVNHDLEDTFEYYQWEIQALSDSESLLNAWRFALAHGTDIQEYVLAGSDIRYISKSELEGFTAEQCRLARNEIYARHGRMFDDEYLKEYFQSKGWYEPLVASEDFEDTLLNPYEIANRDLIVEYEKECGYR